MTACSFNPTTKEVDLGVQGYLWLYREFRANLGYVTLCFKEPKTKVRIFSTWRNAGLLCRVLSLVPSTEQCWCGSARALSEQSLSNLASPCQQQEQTITFSSNLTQLQVSNLIFNSGKGRG